MALCFISYPWAEQAWAEWIGWQLQDAGHEPWLDVWELRPGDDWRAATQDALRRADLVLALVPTAQVDRGHAAVESALGDPTGPEPIPVLLGDGPIPSDLRDRQVVRLGGDGLDESAAREILLQAVAPGRPATGGRLRRFGATSPRMPGTRPRVWRVPPRADRFVGRVELLKDLRAALTARSRAVLVGEPGAGKTQLAVEYAQRFAGEYELVWWFAPGSGHAATVQVSDLATHLGAPADQPTSRSVTALAAELRVRNRWLLVFDDVLDEADAELPERLLREAGTGQVLLISSNRDWTGFGDRIEVGPLSSEESVALLRGLAPTVTARGARAVAAGGNILPLAVGMAAGAINSGVSADHYSASLSAPGRSTSPPHSLAQTVRVGLAELSERNPSAVALLKACALLAPEPFRLRDCTHVPQWAPEPLATLLRRDGRTQTPALGALDRFDLARTSDGTVRVHAAVQSLLRDQMSPAERADAALGAQAMLVSAVPSLRTTSKPPWFLLPHLLAIAPRDLTRAEGLKAACEGCLRLLQEGDAAAAATRLTALREASIALLGADDPSTLEITSYLIDALQKNEQADVARPLAEDRLNWLRTHAGSGKPVTLRAAAQLTALLIESEDWAAALELGTGTRKLMRAELGPDHPTHLELASALLTPLRALGLDEEGVRLGEETLARQRRTLGPEHRDTLRTAARLVALLVDAGELEEAGRLAEETFFQSRKELGPASAARFRIAVLSCVPLLLIGRKKPAESLLEATVVRQRQDLGLDHIDTLRTAALLSALHLSAAEGPVENHRPAIEAVTAYARKADVPTGVRQRLLDDSPPLEFTTAHLFDEVLRTAADILEPDSDTRPPRPTAPTDQDNVLISHVEADRRWADWIASELERMGYEVRAEAEDTSLGRPLFPQSDNVVVLLSPGYLEAVAPTDDEWAALVSDPRRFIPFFVQAVDPLQLPRPLRDAAVPTLYDLDPDAARDVLRTAMEGPSLPSRPPAFPGAPDPAESDDALLTHRLVNALNRSASLQRRDNRIAVWGLLDVPHRDAVSPRTAMFELVRTLRSRPGGLTDLVDALEMVERSSLATTEVRNVVAEVQRAREQR
ncbi:FxSxx-COOH system tetratricopeptide repeat protein [Streptomyces sp. S.PB5]|uniref:FxSxx-COOH system tetratricopeptide repeat protein n=1 Tax=Streptomyces sp. S.PB5 TaxID=3020844 RepID=UPI0025AF2011|nr:FxSxx-COOH system tetratricopeptide repeat protein [Streptomyces sp. S.PB5]MDN3021105.1 FxSxx-COOH system tetratricopeptide repeat protein [Streptomyces sp. S.PB5]